MVKLIDSQFHHISTENNGSVCSLEKDEDFYVYFCSFTSCKGIGEQSFGGSVFIKNSKGDLTMKNVCTSECEAYFGFVMYAEIAEKGSTYVNEVTTTKSKGKNKASIALNAQFAFVSNYNTSYDAPALDCNIVIQNTIQSQSIYHNYYQNQNDALFVVVQVKNNIYLTKSNFVSNNYSKGDWGYVHTNAQGASLYATDLCFYNNNHFLFDCCFGTIYAERILCDQYSYQTAHTEITTYSITISSDFTLELRNVHDIRNCNARIIFTLGCQNRRSNYDYTLLLFMCISLY